MDDHNKSDNKKRSSSRILRNNAAKTAERKTKKSVGDSLIPIAHVVQENPSNQEEHENLYNNDDNGMQVGVVYKKSYLSQKEKDMCPSGWYNINNLQEDEEAYNHF
eukprot:7254196-Ditylum_brightwellii.AAC.1